VGTGGGDVLIPRQKYALLERLEIRREPSGMLCATARYSDNTAACEEDRDIGSLLNRFGFTDLNIRGWEFLQDANDTVLIRRAVPC
jgi:hypothetical protein